MVTKSKIAFIAAVLGLISASPALAQSFNRGLHAGIASEQHQILAHRNGLSAFASMSRGFYSSDSPANTGGGSLGYNEMLQNDQW